MLQLTFLLCVVTTHKRTKQNSLLYTIPWHLLHRNSRNRWLTRVKPSSKEHHHGGVVRRFSGMAFCISSRPTPVASGEGVDQGQCGWVLLNITNRPRKKIVTKLYDFIKVYTSYSTYNAPKMMVSCFPHASRSSHLPSILPSVVDPCFWLVVAFRISIGGCIRPRRIFVFIFVRRSVHRPKRWYSVTPTRSVHPNIHPTVITDFRLSVGCCVVCSNGGHLRPRPRPSLCFFRGCVLAPQTKEPTMARAQARFHALMLTLSAAHTPPCIGGV